MLMAYKTYGNTWWGNAWLQSLTHIDYSNRLPRGVRYARNGSVTSIEIKKKYIEARVSGSHHNSYKVRIKKMPFTKEEKLQIRELIVNNPFYLSQLACRKLPHALLSDLAHHEIMLFPESWDDMEAKCSCPDWAVPCKHIAAVIYIIANEIDMNPFLVFELHNYDLLEDIGKYSNLETQKGNKMESSIPGCGEILRKPEPEKKEEISDIFAYLQKIDFSSIKH
jgi:uncharacterized Zn finger protein